MPSSLFWFRLELLAAKISKNMAEGLQAFECGESAVCHSGREGLGRGPWPAAERGKQETGSLQSGLLNRTPAAGHGAALGPRGSLGGCVSPGGPTGLKVPPGNGGWEAFFPLAPSWAQHGSEDISWVSTDPGRFTVGFSSSPDCGHAGSPRGVVLSLTAPLGAQGQDL